MKTCSQQHTAFYESLPGSGGRRLGEELLKRLTLQGKAHLKSGSMSRVKGYAGYINKGDKQYAIALFVNNYSCDGRPMTVAIEKLLLQLFN